MLVAMAILFIRRIVAEQQMVKVAIQTQILTIQMLAIQMLAMEIHHIDLQISPTQAHPHK